MKYYQQWMASRYQRSLFKFAARLGYFGWNTFSFALCSTPLWFINLAECSDRKALALAIGLTLLGTGLGLLGLRYFVQPGAGIWVQLEVRRGALGIHMWKKFPSRAALESVAVEAVRLAGELNFRLVRIESPLLVKPGRLALWGATLRRCLQAECLPAVRVTEVPSGRMDFVRAAGFALLSRAMQFDQECKHLPGPSGLNRPTAGFHLHIPSPAQ